MIRIGKPYVKENGGWASLHAPVSISFVLALFWYAMVM